VKESQFQASLIKELKEMFAGCMVLKLDSGYIQGIPDLLVLYRNMWAVLECKRNEQASFQPNQDYYIDLMDGMSFAAYIFPENKEHVLRGLQRAFGLGRASRVSQRV
jgi:hypothetical protein